MYTPDPFEPLYLIESDSIMSYEAKDLYAFASDLESYIQADYNIHDLTNDIQSYSLAYVKKGLLAYKAKFYKLYKPLYDTFTEYCQVALGNSIWHINRLINAARVVLTLVANGYSILPKNESQARLLSNLDEVTLLQVWSEVTRHPPHTITAALIKQYIEPTCIDKTVVCLDRTLLDHLRSKAYEEGLTLDQYLAVISGLNSTDEVTETPDCANWLEDLALLNEEYDSLISYSSMRQMLFLLLALRSNSS